MRHSLLAMLLIAASCSTGPEAPPVDSVELACVDAFCLTHPAGWTVEEGDGFISFTHHAARDQAFATIGSVNQQALVVSAGGTWPAPTEEVVRAFWQLLDEADVARFDRMERLTGGAFRSEGSYESGRLWHLLIPGSGNRGVAVEVRGPNASWKPHADVFFESVEVFD